MSNIIVNPNEQQYLDALRDTKNFGDRRKGRNGVTTAIFARQMRFDLQKGFPATTTKELMFDSVVAELLWFLDAGRETDYRLSLAKLNQIQGKPYDAKNIWTMDQARFAKNGKAKFKGDCGVVYGSQWRRWLRADGSYIDQIADVIKKLKTDPFGRYAIVNAWNPAEIDDMCLPPCHRDFQLFVRHSGRRDKKMYLGLSMNQRSCDMFLGVPFNIASYALLTHMIAQCVDMVPGELVITLTDCHIYLAGLNAKGNSTPSKTHINAVNEQLSRKPMKAPRLWINPDIKDIDSFTMDDFKLIGYKHRDKIKAPLL